MLGLKARTTAQQEVTFYTSEATWGTDVQTSNRLRATSCAAALCQLCSHHSSRPFPFGDHHPASASLVGFQLAAFWILPQHSALTLQRPLSQLPDLVLNSKITWQQCSMLSMVYLPRPLLLQAWPRLGSPGHVAMASSTGSDALHNPLAFLITPYGL